VKELQHVDGCSDFRSQALLVSLFVGSSIGQGQGESALACDKTDAFSSTRTNAVMKEFPRCQEKDDIGQRQTGPGHAIQWQRRELKLLRA